MYGRLSELWTNQQRAGYEACSVDTCTVGYCNALGQALDLVVARPRELTDLLKERGSWWRLADRRLRARCRRGAGCRRSAGHGRLNCGTTKVLVHILPS